MKEYTKYQLAMMWLLANTTRVTFMPNCKGYPQGTFRLGYTLKTGVGAISSVQTSFEKCILETHQYRIESERLKKEAAQRSRERGAEIRAYEGCYGNDLDAN